MHMAGIPRPIRVPFRQKGQCAPARPGNFLTGVFDKGMIVSGIQGIGVMHIDFFLARIRLTLGIFNGDTGTLQACADRPHDMLFLRGLEDVVILIIVADRLQPAIAAFRRFLIGGFEQEEFQLCRHECLKPHILQARHLLFQNSAGGMGDIIMVMILHIAQNQGSSLQPGNMTQCRQIRLESVITIACGPIGRRIALNRFHL